MNNYYTLMHLADNCKLKLRDSFFVSAATSKRYLLELYFSKDNETYRMVFSTKPGMSTFFMEQKKFKKVSNQKNFFKDLLYAKVTDVSLAEHDRFLTISFGDFGKLVFLLYSNHANCIFIKNEQILESFKRNKFSETGTTPMPQPAASVNQLLPKYLKVPAGMVNHVTHQLIYNPVPAWVEGIGFTITNEEYLPGLRSIRYDTVNDGVTDAWFRTVVSADFNRDLDLLKQRLLKVNDRIDVALSKFEDGPSRWEQYEKYGHLLMANQHLNTNDNSDHIIVSDFYTDNSNIKIPLKPGIRLVENATWYYERAKDSRKNQELGLIKKQQIISKQSKLKLAVSELIGISKSYELDKWKKKFENTLRKIGLIAEEGAQIRSPYRKLVYNGYEIWIGRNASSNDLLLRDSHKEDIWMHVRGASGSHVLIRMNKKTSSPDKKILEFAASTAVFYSKLKGSSSVPVIFTRRKFVRKPKGASPGTALVEKEQVILTDPVDPSFLSDQYEE